METVTDGDFEKFVMPMYVKMREFVELVEQTAEGKGIELESLFESTLNTLDEHTALRHEALVHGVAKKIPREFIGPRRPRGRPRKHPKPDMSQEIVKRKRGRPRKNSL